MSRGGKNRHVVCAVIMSALEGLICVLPASATITSIGDIGPTYDSSDPWSISGDLILGAVTDANLVISGGSRVQNKHGFIGRSSDTLALAAATVTGSGSSWQNGSHLAIGDTGRGWLRVEDGAQVTAANAFAGWKAGGNGLVQITGAGSTWDAGEELQVGAAGEGTLYVGAGGRVTNRTGVLGTEATGTGVVTVTGPDSVWENAFVWDNPVLLEGHGGALYVGQSGRGTLGIGSGGRVLSQTGSVGSNATGEGEVVVEGSGSLWENNTTMEVGRAGIGRLRISNGGKILTREAAVAVEPDSEGQITVAGPGSELEVEWGMILGSRGNTSMSVSGGGRVQTGSVTMGAETGSTATVNVTGANSEWTDRGYIYVGDHGRADLLVSEGAWVYTQGIMGIGTGAGGTGTVVATGATSGVGGSALEIGSDGGRSSMTITDGAYGGGAEAWVGTGPGSLGEVMVSGLGSSWGATYNVWIGYYQGEGRLTVSDGAQVETLHGFIGWGPGSIGSVVVTGPDSLFRTSHTLYVGGDEDGPGGTAFLGIYDRGLVDGNSVTIWPTGIVAGDGTLRANEVVNRGTIRPGRSIGTLTVAGNVTFAPGSVLEVEIDNTGGDRLSATGGVAIAGGVVRPIATETITGSHRYVIVEANSVTGRFEVLDTALLDSSILLRIVGLEYEPDSVLLALTQTPFNDPSLVRTDNQRSLGTALQQIAEAGGNDITTVLQQLPTADAVRDVYDQLSGQTMPSLAPVTVAGATRNVDRISGRLRSLAHSLSNAGRPGEAPRAGLSGSDALAVDGGRCLFALGNGAPALGDRPWGVWGDGYGLYGDRESESGVPGYQYTVHGTGFGVDYRLTEQLLLGATGGYSEGDIDHSGSRDSSEISAMYGGLYGRYEASRWYLDSILTYADLDYETRRYVDLLNERLEGNPSGDMLTGYLEAGLNCWCSARTLLQPLAAFQGSTLRIDGFTETGGDSSLTFKDERYESYKGSLGVKLTRQLFEHPDDGRMALELRGRWVHEFGDAAANLDAEFASNPGVIFRVSDAEISRDSAVLGAGLDTWFTRQTRAFLDYDTELNPDNTIHLLTAGLEHCW